MKLPQIINKNLRLLFRNKETAFTILFGPLLIILLVSAAYLGGANNIRVGTFAPDYNSDVNSIISSFEQKNYTISTFNDQNECVNKVKQGVTHACVIFPEEFNLNAKKSQKIILKVDESRQNFVHQITRELGAQVTTKSSSVSQDATTKILNALAISKRIIGEQYTSSQEIDEERATAKSNLEDGKKSLVSMNLEINIPDLQVLEGHIIGIQTSTEKIKDLGVEITDLGIETLNNIEPKEDDNATEKLIEETIDDLNNMSDKLLTDYEIVPERVQTMKVEVYDAATKVALVKTKLEEIQEKSSSIEGNIDVANKNLENIKDKLTNLIGELQYLQQQYDSIEGLEAEGVSNPIITEVETLTEEGSKLTYTFPYLIMLVIMFLGLFIGSSLVVMDKTTKAAFRLFTTATRDEYYVFMSFLTTLIILSVQTIVVLLIGSLFLKTQLFNNFGVSIIVLLIAMMLFSFLGMIIGYLTKTQESAMISSLTLGIVLLFISNLVLPLETMNKVVQSLTSYNPFVVLSEMLRQSMLFSMTLNEISGKLGLLLVGLAILIIAVIIVQKSFKSRFFKGSPGDLSVKEFSNVKKEIKPIIIKDKEVNDVFELLDALDALTRADFAEFLKDKQGKVNPIAKWVYNELGEKKLAKKIRTDSKARMILVLEKYVKKKTKKLSKGM